ncbi:response regulator transcription factor [Vibrio sp. L5-1]|uniref:Response regulator transcription factor n=1 Tax=Vibrio qingdaonensis TaxID=2829491 RepID=A0A9X3CLD0_9VIBR|nr:MULTISPECIES: response regulator transcription factor [Vibrio]MCF7497068.1 response regulator transcription factor [Vibrio sp. L5-1]MCW8345506.1 response regulator transcription factor [Vibrio qingdaonensis]
MKNVLIVDSQPLYSEALANLVIDVINTVDVQQLTSCAKVMELVRNQSIDLIILDVVIGDRDGMRLAKNILASGYQGKILFVSSKDYSSLSKAAYELGANGFLHKNRSKNTIKDAIISIVRGYSVFDLDHSQFSSSPALSKQEALVFHYLAQGYSNKRISEQLSLSAKTVSTYKTRILKKYHANSLIELLHTFAESENTKTFSIFL